MRPEGWPERLDAYVAAARARPFAWGTHDCITFTCGWHKLMTGRDVFAPFRGKYASEEEAAAIMLKHDVRDMNEAGAFLFGAHIVGGRLAARGDIVLGLGALGISIGPSAALLQETGVAFVPQRKFEMTWRV